MTAPHSRLPFARPRYSLLARAVTASVMLAACSHGARTSSDPVRAPYTATSQRIGTTALLQAISVVDSNVVWVSGHRGSYARTTDGGATWHAAVVPGADSLQFRDVHAVDASTAYLMSAGNGELSRIYKTTDGGATWRLQFTNHAPKAFYDCMAFWDADHGIAMSDEVGGNFPIIATEDGGSHWSPVDPAALPAALPGEGSFAASGSCVVTRPPGLAWIGTGNTSAARVIRTADRGRTWEVAKTPLPAAEGMGLASLAFRDELHGVAMGGSMTDTASLADDIAVTSDGGRSWTSVGRAPFASAIYGGAYVPGATTPTIVAVGPGGAAMSSDEGRSWVALDTAAYWSVGFASPDAGWAVGPGGRITRFSLARPH
jgi:photosystem II stability/assembly factor-like uncharacterized protein